MLSPRGRSFTTFRMTNWDKKFIFDPMNIILQTPRLLIRQFLPDEEQLFVDLYHDEGVTRHLTVRNDDERRKRFKELLNDTYANNSLGRWGVFNTGDGDFIGTCKLMPNDTDPDKIELGYVLAQKYWGKGLATELAKALVSYGFNKKGLWEICACTDSGNIASQNVLLKAGLVSDGTVFWHGRELPFFTIKNNLQPRLIAQTPRLIIREYTPALEVAYLSLFDDELVTKHLPQRTTEQHMKIFRDTFPLYSAGKILGRWGIFMADNDEFVGMCLLRPYLDDPDKIEVGYAMPQKVWGKGLGTEMTKVLVNYAFENTTASEVVGITTLENIASQKVLQNAGLVRMPDVERDGEILAYFRMERPK
jgi:ribosomal-protein-alanine N-acetyltransferase